MQPFQGQASIAGADVPVSCSTEYLGAKRHRRPRGGLGRQRPSDGVPLLQLPEYSDAKGRRPMLSRGPRGRR